MGFFKDFKEDFNDAVNELVPGGDDTATEEVMVNTLDGDIDVESELTKLDGLLEQVSKKVDTPAESKATAPVKEQEPEKKSFFSETKKETKMIQILNKDPLKDYSISGMTVESIKNKYMKKETFHNIYIIERDNALHIHECLKLKDIIFVNPIQIDYKIINDVEEKTVSDKNVHSTTQIDATLKNIKAAKEIGRAHV